MTRIVCLLALGGVLMSLNPATAQEKWVPYSSQLDRPAPDGRTWNPYTGQWETAPQPERKWNPYNSSWETAAPGSVLQYNPRTGRFGYAAPAEKPPLESRWETATPKDEDLGGAQNLYRPRREQWQPAVQERPGFASPGRWEYPR